MLAWFQDLLQQQAAAAPRQLYLDLLKRCVTNAIYHPEAVDTGIRPAVWEGFPLAAHSMLSMQRLDNLQYCIEQVLRDGIPGDLIETGVWRGGGTIFMRAVLKAYGVTDRTVWVADSFQGLPPPKPEFAADADSPFHTLTDLAIPLEQVQKNFATYGLLDDQVRFLKGWFSDTLPTCPIDRIAVLRLDGDMYESTIVALEALYPKLSPGGFLIVDDYGAVTACEAAVRDFREAHHITIPMTVIDWAGVFWRKPLLP